MDTERPQESIIPLRHRISKLNLSQVGLNSNNSNNTKGFRNSLHSAVSEDRTPPPVPPRPVSPPLSNNRPQVLNNQRTRVPPPRPPPPALKQTPVTRSTSMVTTNTNYPEILRPRPQSTNPFWPINTDVVSNQESTQVSTNTNPFIYSDPNDTPPTNPFLTNRPTPAANYTPTIIKPLKQLTPTTVITPSTNYPNTYPHQEETVVHRVANATTFTNVSSTPRPQPCPVQCANTRPAPPPLKQEVKEAFNDLSSVFRKTKSFVGFNTCNKGGTVHQQYTESNNNYIACSPVPATTTVTPIFTQNFSDFEEDCLHCRDFSVVDTHAANFPRETVYCISNLARDLCSPFPSRTDKARAIFIWLHHNIAYDTVSFFGNNIRSKSPEETVRSGLAVCQGYAELFAALGKYCNLECIVVSGFGKGYGYKQSNIVPSFESNHAWNAVRLDSGQWHLVDACWGAGQLFGDCYKKNLAIRQFTSSPEVFRFKHYPTNPQYQFGSRVMTWEEFIMMRDGPLLYSTFHEKGFSEITIEPNTKVIRPYEPTRFVITTRCKHTAIQPRDQEILLLKVDSEYIPFQVNSTGTMWTCETSAIRLGSEVMVTTLDTLAGKSAKGITVQEYTQSKGRVAMSFSYFLCKWDVC